jgi:hypothetical protein
MVSICAREAPVSKALTAHAARPVNRVVRRTKPWRNVRRPQLIEF